MDEIIKQLPPLEIPPLNIPIEIQTLAHPAIVHFAIAIPIIVLLIEIFNTFFKKRALSVASLLMLMLLSAIALGAYLSGVVDGKAAADNLSSDAMATLKEHKIIGIYLVYASGVVLIFKMLSMLFNVGFIRFLFVLTLIGYSGLSLYQGKEGGELVYKYGANVGKVVELDEKLLDLGFDLDDAKSEASQATKKLEILEANLSTLKSSMPDSKAIEEEKEKLNGMIEALTNEKSTVMKELNELKTKASDEATKLSDQLKILEAQKAKAQAQIETLTTQLKEAKANATEASAQPTPAPVETNSVNAPNLAKDNSAE
ncbi:MAG: DUF2231 domain-containing protein [Campylobacterota bacterium]|nr:DUF2231 domain-containing protein [Campylobacterota bacterium]